MPDLAAVNALDPDAFVALLGGVFEHSAWVAEGALPSRPFSSIDDLHAAMIAVVRNATEVQRLGFLNGHPELAGPEARHICAAQRRQMAKTSGRIMPPCSALLQAQRWQLGVGATFFSGHLAGIFGLEPALVFLPTGCVDGRPAACVTPAARAILGAGKKPSKLGADHWPEVRLFTAARTAALRK